MSVESHRDVAEEITGDAGPDRPRPGLLSSLAYRDFRVLWAGQACHAASIWMEQIARPWLVLDITDGNAAHVGGVVAMRTVPQLLFGLLAGVVADSFDRKTILVATKAAVLLLNLAFVVLLLSNQMTLGLIYLTSFLRGSAMAFDQPARQSMIASIVPPSILTNAVALMSSTQNIMRMVGVLASGLVIAWLGINGAFVIIAVISVGAFLATLLIRVPRVQRATAQGVRGMAGGMMEGFRFALGQPVILGVLITSLCFFTFGMSWTQVFVPILAREVMDIGAIGFSVIVASSALGALAGTLVVASRYPKRLGLILPLTVMGMGGGLMLFAGATYLPGTWGIVVPIAIVPLVGLMQTTYFSLSNATMLTAAPEQMRGRVISLLSLDRAMISVGASAGGLLAASQGAQFAQFAYGAVVAACGVAVFLLLKEFRAYRAP